MSVDYIIRNKSNKWKRYLISCAPWTSLVFQWHSLTRDKGNSTPVSVVAARWSSSAAISLSSLGGSIVCLPTRRGRARRSCSISPIMPTQMCTNWTLTARQWPWPSIANGSNHQRQTRTIASTLRCNKRHMTARLVYTKFPSLPSSAKTSSPTRSPVMPKTASLTKSLTLSRPSGSARTPNIWTCWTTQSLIRHRILSWKHMSYSVSKPRRRTQPMA